jgi:hypothetical protein
MRTFIKITVSILLSYVCSSCTPKHSSNIPFLQYSTGDSYENLLSSLHEKNLVIDTIPTVFPGNYIRLFPVEISGLTGALCVLEKNGNIFRMDWYLDSLPATPSVITFPNKLNTSFSWRHATQTDYQTLKSFLTSQYKNPQVKEENNLCALWGTDLLLGFFKKGRSLFLTKKNNVDLLDRFDELNFFFMRSLYPEDLNSLRYDKDRSDYLNNMALRDTSFTDGSSVWKFAYSSGLFMGLPGHFFFDVHSQSPNKKSSYSKWLMNSVYSDYYNSEIFFLVKANITNFQGASTYDTTFYNPDTKQNDLYYEWENDSAICTAYFTPGNEISVEYKDKHLYPSVRKQ